MQPFAYVEIYSDALAGEPLYGRLLEINSEGFYRVKLQRPGGPVMACFPIASTILLESNWNETPAAERA